MDVGGKDAKDAWMVTNYLKTLPYVDTDRVGVWGLSYGGFFTLIAVTDQPKLFRAAVDVAGVADYAMYYEDPYHGGWTASRIGTPEQTPAGLRQGVAAVARRSAGAAAARPARHVRRERAVPAFGPAHRRAAEEGQRAISCRS